MNKYEIIGIVGEGAYGIVYKAKNKESGEIGIIYRSGYCASKFAVTGFFESLRMELGDKIDITIICPITVETSFREHSLI